MTGEAVTVTDQVAQPSNIVLSQDETEGYVVDLHHSIPGEGGLYRVNLASGAITLVVTGLDLPFAVAVNRAETLAYVGTIFPVGSLLRVDLQTGQVTTIADEMVSDISGMTLSADERRAYVTDFGGGAYCTGKLSVVDIDPSSPSYGEITTLLSGLCGPHGVRLNQDETAAYVVEVDGRRLIRVDLLHAVYIPLVLRRG
jgi:sugar lactone lactonase YvrE